MPRAHTATSSKAMPLPSLPSWASLINNTVPGAPVGPFREDKLSICSYASGRNREAGP